MPKREMKESGIDWIGNIPVDWKIERNKNCFSYSKKIVGEEWKNTQLLSLTTKGVKEKSYDEITGKVPDDFGTYQLVEPNDNVMCLFDLDVSAVFSGISNYKGMISPAYKILKCKARMLPKYADYWFSFVFVERKFRAYSKNIRYTLNYDEFACLPILCPSIDKQEKIVSHLDTKITEINNAIENTKLSIEEYKRLKQSIITESVIKGLNSNVAMKKSGFDWIGDVPKHWEIYKLRYLGNLAGGMSNKKPEDFGHGTPFVSYKSIYKNITLPETVSELVDATEADKEKYSVKYGDTFFTGSSETIEELGLSSTCLKEIPNSTFNGFCMRFRPKSFNNYCPEYMKYYYRSDAVRTFLVAFDNSVTRTNLSQSKLKNIVVLVPPKDEQLSIAEYLDKKCEEIDKCIGLKEKLICELETYKKSLIYEYVTGKKEVEL